jgi:nicotinate phosphoribosyltransferase
MIHDELIGISAERTIVDPLDATHQRRVVEDIPGEDLLVPIVQGGQIVYELPSLTEIRARTAAQLAMFHPGIRRLVNPHVYPVGLEHGLHELKTRLILEARGAGAKDREATDQHG